MNEIILKDAILGLKELDPESFDVVLADPPYNIGKDFGESKDNLKLNEYLEWCDEWISECIKVLKPSGTIYIYGFPEILCHVAVRFPLEHKWLTWHYTNKTIPRINFWQRSQEAIICGWKNKKLRIFNRDDVREEYTTSFLKNAAGKPRQPTKGRFSKGDKKTTYTAHDKGALPRDVIKTPALAGGAGAAERWFYSKSKQKAFPNKDKASFHKEDIVQHPTQKPYELTKRLLLAAKPKEDGKVLIPFVGSGAECAVAEDLGLKYLGFEINEDYVKLAKSFLRFRLKSDSKK